MTTANGSDLPTGLVIAWNYEARFPVTYILYLSLTLISSSWSMNFKGSEGTEVIAGAK